MASVHRHDFASNLRFSGLLYSVAFLVACQSEQTAIELEFFAESEVSIVRLVDEEQINDDAIVTLAKTSGGACRSQSRGTFLIGFPDDSDRTELKLSVIGLDEQNKTVLGRQLTTSISVSKGQISQVTVNLCASDEGRDAGAANDGGQSSDAGVSDVGLTGDDASFDDAGVLDSGSRPDAMLDTGVSTDSGTDSDAMVPDSGVTLCGNSVLDGNEQCDDGNRLGGDGCNAACQVENDYECGRGVRGPSHCFDTTNLQVRNLGPTSNLTSEVESDGSSRVLFLSDGVYEVINDEGIDGPDNRTVTIVATGPNVVIRRGGSGNRTVFDVEGHVRLFGVTIIGEVEVSEGGLLEIYDSNLYGRDSTQAAGDAVDKVVDMKEANSRLVLERNKISRAVQSGIELNGTSGSSFRVVNNFIFGNGHRAINIRAQGSGPNTIEHNTISETSSEMPTTFSVRCAQNFTLKNNLFFNNGTKRHGGASCSYQDVAYGNPSSISGSATGAVVDLGMTSPFMNSVIENYRLTPAAASFTQVTHDNAVERDFDYQVRTPTTNLGADHVAP